MKSIIHCTCIYIIQCIQCTLYIHHTMYDGFHKCTISFIISLITRTCEPRNDQLPTSVASQLSWLERRTGIARSRVQSPLKSWKFFQVSRRNSNCVHNCEATQFHLISGWLFLRNAFSGYRSWRQNALRDYQPEDCCTYGCCKCHKLLLKMFCSSW